MTDPLEAVLANPGSPEAIKQGCTCPSMDNHNGKGFPWGGKDMLVENRGMSFA